MKHKQIILSLLAIILLINTVQSLYLETDNNYARCVDSITNEGEAGILIDTIYYSGGILNTGSRTFTADETNFTGIVTTPIGTLPCGTIIYCIGNYSIYNSSSFSEIVNATKQCTTVTTLSNGTLPLSNYSNGTISGGTGGTIPGADISSLSSSILGLSKAKFFILASCLIITVIMLGFRPAHLGIGISCVAMCVLIMVMQWFTLSSTLIMLICILGALYFLSKS